MKKVKEWLKNYPFVKLVYCFLFRKRIYKKSFVDGIVIELTDLCNLRCSYCPKGHGIGVDGDHMDFDLFKNILDQAIQLTPMRNVVLTGFGEPLLYPRIIEAVKYAKEKGAERIFITTNGILLNDSVGKKLLNAGLTDITISVNAFSREKYMEINRADKYDEVVANALSFLRYANKANAKANVVVQILEKLNSEDDVRGFKAFWKKELGICGKIQIQPYVNWAGILSKPHVSPEKRYPCAHIQSSWIITREGNALACCMLFPGQEGDLSLGNVKSHSLEEIYFRGKILALRKENMRNALANLEPCKYCDAYKTVPNMWIKNPLAFLGGRKWF